MKYLLLLLLIPVISLGQDLDELVAKTSLALGNEYYKLAQDIKSKIVTCEELSDGCDDYLELVDQYDSYKQLALSEYQAIICTASECASDFGILQLSSGNYYLRKEAMIRFDQITKGLGANGVIGNNASIYAVNSNFEEHLMGHLDRLIADQVALDKEARAFRQTYLDLQSAYVGLDDEIVGVEQSLLRDTNYTAENQSQILSYEECVEGGESEAKFESNEIDKAYTQIEILESNSLNFHKEMFDIVVPSAFSSGDVIVSANKTWQSFDFHFDGASVVSISGTGQWNVKGAATEFADGQLYYDSDSNDSAACWALSNNGKGVSAVSNLKNGLKTDIKLSCLENFNHEAVDMLSTVGMQSITLSGFRTDAGGYMFSMSSSIGGSQSGSSGSSSSSSKPNKKGDGTISSGSSSSSSSGVSNSSSVGATFPLRLTTTFLPEAPLGSLIGSFCDEVPDGENCEVFVIGSNLVLSSSEINIGKKLWLRANDSSNVENNTGSISVSVRTSTKVAAYWNEFVSWSNKKCDDNGEHCGLEAILNNIAYSANPFLVAKSSFYNHFPLMPAQLTDIFLQYVNYAIEKKVIERDIKTKEHSRELQLAKIEQCKRQLVLAKDSLSRAYDLVATYQRREQNTETRQLLLDTSKSYYESELSNLNQMRDKNLERIKRYFAYAVNAYNYLFLDQFSAAGEPKKYHEGDYYYSQLNEIKDLVFDITTENDLLNPNRGFVVYELNSSQLKPLQSKDFRDRKVQVRLDIRDFFCDGFNLEDQSRVMIDKVGVLLDIDPENEYKFFTNPHVRSTKVSLTHGAENRLFDFYGNEHEFWMPGQKRKVNAISSRVLVDSDSDYMALRESRYFDRLSFRKTSFSTTWNIEMRDPSVQMFDSADVDFSNPYLKGVKLVFWYNSTETQNDGIINSCLIPPFGVAAAYDATGVAPKINLQFSIDVDDPDFETTDRYFVYRSFESDKGFERVGYVDKSDVSACRESVDSFTCEWSDSSIKTLGGDTIYYKVRSAYKDSNKGADYMYGIWSTSSRVTVP